MLSRQKKKDVSVTLPLPSELPRYRFGFYAGVAGGKTCSLAALAMPRLAHPQGVSCTWIPDPSQARRSSLSARNAEESAAFDRGRELITEAIEHLKSGGVPLPTTQADPFRLLYYFTTPQGTFPCRKCGTVRTLEQRQFLVELIDYSGELLNTGATRDEFSQQLRDHLHGLDGLFILAEAPNPKETSSFLDHYLTNLRQAFALLMEERAESKMNNAPIALLVNKWDRRGEIQRECAEHEQEKLESFLNGTPEPPHRLLADVLRGTCSTGNFKAFPISAFGSFREKDTPKGIAQVPKEVEPLPSFGLEDSILWLVEHRDEMDLRRLETSAQQLSVWRRPHLEPDPTLLLRRFKGRPENEQRVLQAQRRARKVSQKRAGAFITTLALLPFLTFVGYDFFQRRDLERLQALSTPSVEEIATVTSWLKSYRSAHPSNTLRALSYLFILPLHSATGHLNNLEKKREAALAQRFTLATKDSADQLQYAQAYLQEFPLGQGESSRDAMNIIERAEHAPHAGKYVGDFRVVLAEAEQVLANGTISSDMLKETWSKINKLPPLPPLPTYPEHIRDLYLPATELARKAQEYGEELNKRYQKALDIETKDKVINLLAEGDATGAAREYLLLKESEDPTVEEFRKAFPDRLYQVAEDKWKKFTDVNDYRTGQEYINQIVGDINVVYILSTQNRGDILRNLQGLIDKTHEQEDQFLYESIRLSLQKYDPPRIPPGLQENIDEYLKNSTRKMTGEIHDLKQEIERLGGPLDLMLSVRKVHSDNPYVNSKHFLSVQVGTYTADAVYEPPHKNADNYLNASTTIPSVRLNDTITVKALCTVNSGYFWRGYEDCGSLEEAFLVKNLLSVKTLRLISKDWATYGTAIDVQLTGRVQKPELLPWNSR